MTTNELLRYKYYEPIHKYERKRLVDIYYEFNHFDSYGVKIITVRARQTPSV